MADGVALSFSLKLPSCEDVGDNSTTSTPEGGGSDNDGSAAFKVVWSDDGNLISDEDMAVLAIASASPALDLLWDMQCWIAIYFTGLCLPSE